MSRKKETPEHEDWLPMNREAERVILGSILLDNARYAEMSQSLDAEDFGLHAHRELFQAMGRMIAAGVAVDTVTLYEEYRKTPALQSIGGAAYIASLTEGLPRRLACADYCRIVKEKSNLRRLLVICQDIVKGCAEPGAVSIDIGRAAVRNIKAIFAKKATA